MEQEMKIKIVVLGDPGSGKTSLVMSYATKKFPGMVVPTVSDYYTAHVSIDTEDIKEALLFINDTSGLDSHLNLRELHYPDTDVLILCFSLTDPQAMDQIKSKWFPEIRKNFPNGIPLILVGTKKDRLDNEPEANKATKTSSWKSFMSSSRTTEDTHALKIKATAKQIGAIAYYECSAKTGYNLKTVFDEAVLAMIEKEESKPSMLSSFGETIKGLFKNNPKVVKVKRSSKAWKEQMLNVKDWADTSNIQMNVDRSIAEDVATLIDLEKDDSRQTWNKDAVLNLMKTCVSKILFVGKYESGKTSIARSLVGNHLYTTAIRDRTVVMHLKNWKIDDDTTATIYDLGGHPTYKHTVHFFYADDVSNTIVVTHKITSDDYNESGKWLKSAIQSSPSATVIFALTQTDLVENKEEIISLENKFTNFMKSEIVKEIRALEVSIHFSDNKSRVKELQKVLNSYRKTLNSLSDSVFPMSCIDISQLQSTKLVKTKIVQENQFGLFKDRLALISKGHVKDIPELYYKVYTEIGKLGMERSRMLSEESEEDTLSSDSFDDEEDLENVLEKDKRKKPSVSDPTTFTSEIKAQLGPHTLQYLTFDHACKIFKSLYSEMYGNEVDENALKHEVKTCLEWLHSLGLIIWFGKDSVTSNIIFNDIASFTDLLSALFHHNLKNLLTFELLSFKGQVRYQNKIRQFNGDVDKLTQKGILTENLLYCLLCPFQFENHLEVVVSLLEKIGICHNVQKQKDIEIFLPWFCDELKIPHNLENALEWITQITTSSLVQCFSYTGRIPIAMFHYLCTSLYKEYETNDHTQDREIWANGFWAWLGEMALLILYEEDRGIHVIAKAHVSNLESTQYLWKQIRFIDNELERLSKEWFLYAFGNKSIVCNHCLLLKPKASSMLLTQLKVLTSDMSSSSMLSFNLDFHTWNMDNILGATSDLVKSCNCKKLPGVFPASLLHPLPEGSVLATVQHQQLVSFLKEHAPQETNKEWVFPEHDFTHPTILAQRVENLHTKVENLKEKVEQGEAPLDKDKITSQILKDNYDLLVDNMVPDTVDSHLFAGSVISVDEFQLIGQDITSNKVRRILYAVDQAGGPGIKELIRALESTNQGHIVQLLINKKEAK